MTQDGVDCVAVDAKAVHADERRGAAVDQKGGARRAYMKASVETAAAAEGVPATDESNVHG